MPSSLPIVTSPHALRTPTSDPPLLLLPLRPLFSRASMLAGPILEFKMAFIAAGEVHISSSLPMLFRPHEARMPASVLPPDRHRPLFLVGGKGCSESLISLVDGPSPHLRRAPTMLLRPPPPPPVLFLGGKGWSESLTSLVDGPESPHFRRAPAMLLRPLLFRFEPMVGDDAAAPLPNCEPSPLEGENQLRREPRQPLRLALLPLVVRRL